MVAAYMPLYQMTAGCGTMETKDSSRQHNVRHVSRMFMQGTLAAVWAGLTPSIVAAVPTAAVYMPLRKVAAERGTSKTKDGRK
jgi:uncharacterized protein (DUF2062 family)